MLKPWKIIEKIRYYTINRVHWIVAWAGRFVVWLFTVTGNIHLTQAGFIAVADRVQWTAAYFDIGNAIRIVIFNDFQLFNLQFSVDVFFFLSFFFVFFFNFISFCFFLIFFLYVLQPLIVRPIFRLIINLINHIFLLLEKFC